jgi:hypothetical protein
MNPSNDGIKRWEAGVRRRAGNPKKNRGLEKAMRRRD